MSHSVVITFAFIAQLLSVVKLLFLTRSLILCVCLCACTNAVSIRDRHCPAVSIFLDPPEDECGGSSARREAHGCLHEGGPRGCGWPLQETNRCGDHVSAHAVKF